MHHSKYWVIIPAAGIGARMHADRPKQYIPLQQKPMLAHVIDCLTAIDIIEKVVVVLNTKDHWYSTLNLNDPSKVLATIGGKKRVDSVFLGLSFLTDYIAEDDWVLVHDAARPCIQAADILHLIDALSGDAVGGLLGLPVVDTLKKVDANGRVLETVSRECLWRAQTPQLFRAGVLKNALQTALSDDQAVTDEASAVEYMGLQPKMVLGSVSNIKVTFPEDIALAEWFLR